LPASRSYREDVGPSSNSRQHVHSRWSIVAWGVALVGRFKTNQHRVLQNQGVFVSADAHLLNPRRRGEIHDFAGGFATRASCSAMGSWRRWARQYPRMGPRARSDPFQRATAAEVVLVAGCTRQRSLSGAFGGRSTGRFWAVLLPTAVGAHGHGEKSPRRTELGCALVPPCSPEGAPWCQPKRQGPIGEARHRRGDAGKTQENKKRSRYQGPKLRPERKKTPTFV